MWWVHSCLHARSRNICLGEGGGGRETASTEKGLYFLYNVSCGRVRTSIPMETNSTCDFRGGEGVR